MRRARQHGMSATEEWLVHIKASRSPQVFGFTSQLIDETSLRTSMDVFKVLFRGRIRTRESTAAWSRETKGWRKLAYMYLRSYGP